MSNSFGFGGNNAVLIFSRPETTPLHPRAPAQAEWRSLASACIGPGSSASAKSNRRCRREKFPFTVAARWRTPRCSRQTSAGVWAGWSQMALMCRAAQPNARSRRNGWPWRSARAWAASRTAGRSSRIMISKDEREPMPTRFPNLGSQRCPPRKSPWNFRRARHEFRADAGRNFLRMRAVAGHALNWKTAKPIARSSARWMN